MVFICLLLRPLLASPKRGGITQIQSIMIRVIPSPLRRGLGRGEERENYLFFAKVPSRYCSNAW
jgi:hypothetical protein